MRAMVSGRRRTTDRRNLLVIVVMVLIGCSSGPPAPTGTASGQPTSTSPGTTATHTDQGTESPPPEVDYTRTSEARIAAGLAAGTIDYPTSLLYRVYAAFGDPALPADYRSDIVDLHAATFAFAEIAAHVDELTPDMAAALAPYLARPNEEGSIFNSAAPVAAIGPIAAAPEWAGLPAAGGKARVWVAKSDVSEALLDYYKSEVDKVWPKVFSLTREPIPDTPGEPLVNPDSAIDLFFVPLGSVDPRVVRCETSEPDDANCRLLSKRGGYTRPTQPNTGHTSSGFIVIDEAARGDLFTANIAHELTHTSQYSYDYTEGSWLLDSTATWAEYRTLQLLGRPPSPAYDYLGEFFGGLDKPLRRDEGLNRYGSWLYFLSLQIDHGDQIVRSVFEKMAADGAQNAAAINDAYPFSANFGKFAVSNWNRDKADRYRDKDRGFPAGRRANLDYDATINPGGDQLDFETSFLSADYARYTFSDDVKQVVFDNRLATSIAECGCVPSVWLIASVKGTWKDPEEVGDKREYCFARANEDLDELIVVVANTDWEGLLPLTTEMMPTLTATDEECELADVEGTITWSYHETYHDSGGGLTHDLDSRRQATISVRMNEGERGFEDAGSSFAWTGDETSTETSSLCTIQMDTQFEGAGPFSDHGLEGASIGLSDNGDGTWTLSATVAGTMHFANSWTAPDCEITRGGEQETAEFVGCTDDALDLWSAYTDLAVGTLADDGLTIAFRCEETFTEPNEVPVPAGQRTTTITLNGTLNRTTRSPAGP